MRTVPFSFTPSTKWSIQDAVKEETGAVNDAPEKVEAPVSETTEKAPEAAHAEPVSDNALHDGPAPTLYSSLSLSQAVPHIRAAD